MLTNVTLTDALESQRALFVVMFANKHGQDIFMRASIFIFCPSHNFFYLRKYWVIDPTWERLQFSLFKYLLVCWVSFSQRIAKTRDNKKVEMACYNKKRPYTDNITRVQTFSCLDHTFPVHLFYLLYMQKTGNLNITGLVQ